MQPQARKAGKITNTAKRALRFNGGKNVDRDVGCTYTVSQFRGSRSKSNINTVIGVKEK
jgi:hypothetical protein